MEWLLFAIAGAIVAPTIATAKGRSAGGWAVAGFVFGLFAVLVVAVLPSRETLDQRAARRMGAAVGAFRICPLCAEPIRVEAKKCRFCQSEI